MKKAIGYARTATKKQADEFNSIKQQKILIKNYCRKNKIQLLNVFADSGKSGMNLNRPGFKKMLKQAKKRSVDFVIVWDWFRLTRNLNDYVSTSKKFKQNKTRLISLAHPQSSLSKPENNLIDNILYSINAFYSQ